MKVLRQTNHVDSYAKHGDHAAAKTIIRNKAGEKGANYLRLETYSIDDAGWVHYTGTAFKWSK